MKKYLLIFLVLFLCAFLFTSCEELGDLIGELIGGGDSEGGDEEQYDYRGGGGGSTATLAGTWTAKTKEFGEDFSFNMVDCDLTVTINGNDISIIEIYTESGNTCKSLSGTFELVDSLIKVTKSTPEVAVIYTPWVSMKTVEGGVKVFEVSEREDLDHPEAAEAGQIATVEGNTLSYSSVFDLMGVSSSSYMYDFSPVNHTALKKDDTFSRRVLKAEMVKYEGDELVTIEEEDRLVTAKVDQFETTETGVILKYSEVSCAYDKYAMWYKYDAETNSLLIYWGGEAVTLTKQP